MKDTKSFKEKIDVIKRKLRHEEQVHKQNKNRYIEQVKALSDEISKYRKLTETLEEANKTLQDQNSKKKRGNGT